MDGKGKITGKSREGEGNKSQEPQTLKESKIAQ
jgi:hypothetical protein